MAIINFATREITGKIVYFGARGAGCNTNVARLHALVPARRRGELLRLAGGAPELESEHAWCFDALSDDEAPIPGFGMCWQLWSLPGGLEAETQREGILRGLDAVVFVADAREGRNDDNVAALLKLELMLGRLGQELAHTAVVLQVNHTDAVGARSQADVIFDLNPYGFPVSEAVASDGRGILETHADVTAAVRARIADALAGHPSPLVLTAMHDPEGSAEHDLRRQQETALTGATPPSAEPTTSDPLEERSFISEEPTDLPEGPQVEVAFQPREFLGSHPARVLGAQVEADRVVVELVMEHMGGGEARRLTVVLLNRPTDTPPMQRPSHASPEPKAGGPSVFDYLPESAADVAEPQSEEGPADLPGVWYGVLGVAGGVLIGILTSYLLGVVL